MKPNSTEKKDQKLLWRIHHWAGFYAGILIAVLSLTGAMAVFIPEIDFLIQKKYYSVSSTPASELKFGASLEKLKRAYPEMGGLAISLPQKSGQVATVSFSEKGKGKASAKRHYFFIDAGKDRVVGSRDQQNSVANFMRQIHVRLYEGTWGRQLVGLGGVALLVLVVTGLLIYSDFMKRQPYPKIRKERGLRILMADWHKILGITALAFNLVISATGAWLGLQPKLMQWFDIKTPNAFKPKEVHTALEDSQTAIRWNDILKATKQQFPDLSPHTIRVSDDGTSTITIHGDIKGQVYERGANTLILSKTTLAQVFKYDIREKPFGHKFYFVQEALHFGDYGGLALKIIYTLLGLTSGFLSISGFVVYLYRTDKKADRKSVPLKIMFLYSAGTMLILALLAITSTMLGYSLAATLAGILINGGLLLFLVYTLYKYILKKYRSNPISTAS